MTEGRSVQRLFRVTPPLAQALGARGPAYGGKYSPPYAASTRKYSPPYATVVISLLTVLYPQYPFGLVARVSATHKRDHTVAGPPQSPTRSLEGSGSQTDPQPLCVCVLLLQDLLQSCSRGGGRRVEDMCYERRRAEACVNESAHHALVNAGGREIV